MLALGRAAADAINEVGDVPLLVAELPADGLDPGSVRYLHTQEILNGVVYLGYENALRFGPEVDAVVGRYQRPDGGGWLLLVDYPDDASAELAEGGAIELASGDAVVFDAGSAWAAATWYGWSEVGTVAVTTVV